MSKYHLAQINIARTLAPIGDPLMAEFVAQLPPINALADESPGFVWRLQSESGDATSIKVYDDDFIIVNLTVWESVDALREYVYKVHIAESCAIASAGSRNLRVHTMRCGGSQLDILPVQKKARKGWIICENMEIWLTRSRLRMFSHSLQSDGEAGSS